MRDLPLVTMTCLLSFLAFASACGDGQVDVSGSEVPGSEDPDGPEGIDPDGPDEPMPDDPDGSDPEGSDPDADVPPREGDSGLPCDVSTVLATHCAGCHGETLRYGAPMPLLTLEDLHAPGISEPAVPMYDLVLERMEDVQAPMPPRPNPAATEAEIAAMEAWIDAGAAAGKVCDEDPFPLDEPGDNELPPPSPECDHVFELRAHGLPFRGDDTPYPVPPLTDLYVNFTFQVPWIGEAQGISFHPIIDDDRVLHHWLLYTAPLGAVLDGAIVPGIGAHPGESLVAGWAPGGDPTVMPDNVGLEMPVGPLARFVLEIHYHNDAGHLDAMDRSGVRVCVTTTKREKTAAVHLLGTEVIAMAGPGEFSFKGFCHPWLNLTGLLDRSPVHIISSSPHLHRRGRRITTTIHRADGGTDTLIDTPFDFDNQISYPTPATIYPGDWLETTCTYENPGGIATFGIRTEDEMCQNYLTAWPVGALDTGGSIILSAHACML